MIYKDFGKTGEKISSLGFGCMRLPELQINGKMFIDEDKALPMLMRAYELGVNYFDTAPYYCNKNSEIAVGKALKSVRDKVMISTKIPLGDECKDKGHLRRSLESSLKKLDTDYIDFYHFWGINKDSFDLNVMGMDLIGEALKCKEEGLIRHISFSFHDKAEVIKHIIETCPQLESMLVQYNLLDRSNEDMLAFAHEKGLGTVVMGPVAGGRLAAPKELYKKLTGTDSATSYELAFKFVLGNQNISCALSGMQTMEMVENNVRVINEGAHISEAEWKSIADEMAELKKFAQLYCTGCGYCQPCPKGIKIPRIFEAYTYHNVYGLSELAKKMWNEYKEKDDCASIDECINCGFCEKKCPQKLSIRSELKKVTQVLESL